MLDGGVHTTAALRLILGAENPLVSVSAYTAQLQQHLPPVDTIEAVAKTKNGVVGTISLSFGTTFRKSGLTIACSEGTVSVEAGEVTVGNETKSIADERTGVPPEVRAWGEALAAGSVNEQQSPEEALADLELIEACLRSGEQGAKPVSLECQTW